MWKSEYQPEEDGNMGSTVFIDKCSHPRLLIAPIVCIGVDEMMRVGGSLPQAQTWLCFALDLADVSLGQSCFEES